MPRTSLKAVPALLGLALAAYAVPAPAQGNGGAPAAPPAPSALRAATAVRASQVPKVDGHLDDAAWEAAPPITGFVQHEPLEGRPITERTEVRVL